MGCPGVESALKGRFGAVAGRADWPPHLSTLARSARSVAKRFTQVVVVEQ